MARIFNFSAGPATLPLPVLERIAAELTDYQGSGMSIIEMSHRGKIFDSLYHESLERLRRIAAIPDQFDILYMTGGASMQFAMIPMNLCRVERKAAYLLTGVWAQKAYDQAKLQERSLHVAGDGAPDYHKLPVTIDLPGEDFEYLHLTSNNTIYGTAWQSWPGEERPDIPLAIDMSSDFLSRPIDFSRVGILYAGLQKNAGPSGLTVVLIRRDLYERESNMIPTLLRYSTFAENDSMYNTPPTFQIYAFNLVMQWLEQNGGVSTMAEENRKKAAIIYETIDRSGDFYEAYAAREDRSLMNITFRTSDRSLEPLFVAEAEKAGLSGLKGHRLAGGIRASTYNAMSHQGCRALADFMVDFARRHG